MAMQLGLVLVAVLGACDPGGTYHVPGGIPQGRAYILGGGAQMSLRTSASWFTGSLTASLAITNRGTSPLVVHPDNTRMADREGTLPRYYGHDVLRCDKHADATVTLAPGEACEISMKFEVRTDRARLRTLTLVQDGVTRGDVAVPISVTFELDD
jgi:hypothetical protein